AVGAALLLLVAFVSMLTWGGGVRGLPLPRVPGAAILHHLQIGLQGVGPGPAVRVTVKRPEPTSPTTPDPDHPRAVILPGLSPVHVPILEYHYVRLNPNPEDRLGYNLSVTPASFQAQMDWLATHGYHPIDLASLRAYFAGRVDLPARPVVLTFAAVYPDF